MKIAIFVHHTGDKSPDPQFAKVNAYHKSKNYPVSSLGFYVGYTYFIGKDGTIKQARLETERGAHTVNCGCKNDKTGWEYDKANVLAIGVCLAGDFKKEKPTERQIASLVALVEDMQNRHNIPDANLFNHYDAKNTACPGMDLVAEVLRIKRLRLQLSAAEKSVSRATPTRKARLLRFIGRATKILKSFLP